MAGPDLSVFGRIKTKADYDREAMEFDLKRQLAQAQIESAASGGDLPSNIQEWNAYNSMAPQDQERYLQMKRASQIMDLGGSIGVRSPTGGFSEMYQKTLPPQNQPTAVYAQEVAKQGAGLEAKAAEEINKNIIESQKEAPKQEETAKRLLGDIDTLMSHPGLSSAVGMPNVFGGRIPFIGSVPGSKSADFEAKLATLGGKNFLQAFQDLKGGGQITEIEGKKATDAIASMQTSQSEEQFKKSLGELRDIVIRAQERARIAAERPLNLTVGGGGLVDGNPPVNNPKPKAPKSGDVVGGYMFMGGNPNDKASWKKVK